MAKEIFEFTQLCITQTKHADRMILPITSPQNTLEHSIHSMQEPRKKKSLKKKIRFHHFAIILISSFFLKLLTSIANKLKQLAIELLYTRNDTTFIVVPFFSWPFVCKLARVVVFTSWNFAKFYHFETKSPYPLLMCSLHANIQNICMQHVEPLQAHDLGTWLLLSFLMKGECPTPSSLKMMITIVHNTNIYNT